MMIIAKHPLFDLFANLFQGVEHIGVKEFLSNTAITSLHITGWLLIIFFLLILPANIYAAIKQVNIEKGTLDGNGLSYLWFRVPLQALFIVGFTYRPSKTRMFY